MQSSFPMFFLSIVLIVARLCRALQYHGILCKHIRIRPSMRKDEIHLRKMTELTSSQDSLSRRRPRYSGKYPRKYSEKYKEIRGDEAVSHRVIEKGGTPAGTHVPIMLKQCLDHMHLPLVTNSTTSSSSRSRPVTVDCTLGYGGHTQEIMRRVLAAGGEHICIDQDEIEIKKTEKRMRRFIVDKISDVERREKALKNLTFVNKNFKDIEEIAKEKGIMGEVTGILADLGFSSMQIDDSCRGFTYKTEGPLDMRMCRSDNRPTASELLTNLKSADELAEILEINSDEPYAKEIGNLVLFMICYYLAANAQ